MIYTVMNESGFKQDINFQSYMAMKKDVSGVLPHKQSRAYVGISLLSKTV